LRLGKNTRKGGKSLMARLSPRHQACANGSSFVAMTKPFEG